MENAIRAAAVSSVKTRSVKTTRWAWLVVGGTGKAQRGLKGELRPSNNLSLSAEWVTKCMISCAVLSLHGQLCAHITTSAITDSFGTSLKEENHASFWWLEILQKKRKKKVSHRKWGKWEKWVTEAQERPLKITGDYSINLEQIYEKYMPRYTLCPEGDVLAS